MAYSQIQPSGLLKRPHKLSTVLMALIGLWLIGAIVIVGFSLNISWRLEEMGVAINNSGSLRKRVFHIMMLTSNGEPSADIAYEVDNFKTVADQLRNIPAQNFFDGERHQILQQEILQIEHELEAFLQKQRSNLVISTTEYRQVAEHLTNRISGVVSIIEKDNTESIERLRILQILLILMAVLSAFASSYLLRKLVIQPLNELYLGIQRLTTRKFNAPVSVQINNEFATVADGFNEMQNRLRELYENLEEKVADKTQALSQRNHELLFLYETSTLIQEATDNQVLMTQFLQKVVAYSHAESGSIRLINKNRHRLEILAEENLPEIVKESSYCNILNHCYCGKGVYADHFVIHNRAQNQEDQSQETRLLCQYYISDYLVTIPIHHIDEKLGVITLYFTQATTLSDNEAFILETVTAQFAMALVKIRLAALDKQLAILEERNHLAQGLHDSIAQSLAFIKMQIPLLERALKEENHTLQQQTLSFIKEGIEECYLDIRELLSNFRVRIAQGSFGNTIQSVVARFEHQYHLTVKQHISPMIDLSPEAQLQVIFILQEALSNIRKHAQATEVSITITQNDNSFQMVIKDNGVGFDLGQLNEFEKQGHLGTKIMRERIQKVGGELHFKRNDPQGTIVDVTIQQSI
ncbi:histidine kinase [Ignatzschineria larvae DSM 13226]|uniref:Sensor protein n=1 Tax=Ignatzschineria larvae DSM 13226 TaxID=1111732 RepID=A0ABZ3C2W5_9GAMM|nr:histidine kinase [Ignatzschineria larvae]